jgi:hypothetical protein
MTLTDRFLTGLVTITATTLFVGYLGFNGCVDRTLNVPTLTGDLVAPVCDSMGMKPLF